MGRFTVTGLFGVPALLYRNIRYRNLVKLYFLYVALSTVLFFISNIIMAFLVVILFFLIISPSLRHRKVAVPITWFSICTLL